MVSLHCLRVYLEKSYREALDLLSEMPQILGEIGLDTADLPDHSTLIKWFDRIKTALWRVLLRLSAQLHEPSGHAAIDATFFDRENAASTTVAGRITGFRHSKQLLSSTQKAKPFWTFIVRPRNATTHNGWQVALRNAGDLASLAADKGYDWMDLRDKLREEGVRPLIKHREFRPIDHAHNARIDGPRYRQRAMCETVFSTIKRTLGDAVRARTWYGEFRELVLMCAVHNIKQSLKQ
ncbi:MULTISPECIES: IS5 family transposase [Haloarcula]|uniref:IS5 family transposase n=1 Tax=Haloarcula TaxID=2237 RepID=UPI0024C28BC7|nr:IS5 family transposase [Halomicroarcula sp. YJ-61-S]